MNSPKVLLISSAIAAKVPRIHATIPSSRILRVPFLPRLEPIQPSVKNSLLLENGSVKNSNLNTVLHTIDSLDMLAPSAISNYTSYNASSNQTNESEHCYRILHQATSQHEVYNNNKSQQIEQESKNTGFQMPPLIGTQLATRGNESHMEMSGATPPIATVEDISVPVFIDGQLQGPTKTTTATPTAILNCNNSHSDNNCNMISTCLKEEHFESLGLDIEMLSEDNKVIGAEGHNANHTNLFNYEANANNGIVYINNNNNSSNNNTANTCYELVEPKEEPQYLVAPDIVHYNLSEDTNSLEIDAADILLTEEAIDISAMNNDNFTFQEVFCSSQNDPMLTDGLDFSQKLTNAEPVIPNIDYDAEYDLCIKQQQHKGLEDIKLEQNDKCCDETLELMSATSLSSISPPMKRKRTKSRNIQERQKLHLNLCSKETANLSSPTLNTPDVVNLIADWGKNQSNIFDNSTTQDILKELLDIYDSSSSTPLETDIDPTHWPSKIADNNISYFSIPKLDKNTDSATTTTVATTASNYESTSNIVVSPSCSLAAYIDEDPPYTPQSVYSFTNDTIHAEDCSTLPSSPARAQGKKRGRPSKEHSDKPDPAQLKHLTDTERKRAEERAKNNEASRLSRLKNKLKEEAEVREAEILTERNIAMQVELEKLNRVMAKLKRALQRRHFRSH